MEDIFMKETRAVRLFMLFAFGIYATASLAFIISEIESGDFSVLQLLIVGLSLIAGVCFFAFTKSKDNDDF